MPRRLLFIAYEFPPKGGTQAQHTAKLAKSLAQRGWDVTAITVAEPPASMLDGALADEVAPLVRIEAAWSLEPTRLVQVVRRLRGGSRPASTTLPAAASPASGGARGFTSMPRWFVRLVQALFIPDEKVGWTPYVIRLARRLHREHPFDLVLASGPPFSAFRAARILGRRLRLPWVIDLRDPIVNGYFFRPVTPLHGLLMRRFERRTVGGASAVVVPIPALRDDILARVPEAAGRFLVSPNSFDPADFDGPAPQPAPGFTVSYVGAFQATIRPDTFLAAVARLAGEDAAFAGDVRVRFVGPLDAETAAAIERTGTKRYVERTGFVAHSEATAAMRSSAVNLLVLGPEPASRGIVTSKLPEYLGAGRPVLALVPAGGVAADIVRAAGAGEIVEPTDVGGAVAALRRLHAAWRAGALPEPDPSAVAEFDRDRVADRLSEALSAVAEAGRVSHDAATAAQPSPEEPPDAR